VRSSRPTKAEWPDRPRGGADLRGDDRRSNQAAAAIDSVAGEWDDLANRLDAPPFLRPGWIAAWWRAFGSGDLRVHTFRRDGRLAGLVPLSRRAGTVRSPTNWHTPWFGLLSEPSAAPSLVGSVLIGSGRMRRATISFVDPCEVAAWRSCDGHGFRVLTRTLTRVACVEIDGEWTRYERGLSRNTRSTLKRAMRRLQDAGEVSFEHVEGGRDLDTLLEEGFRIEALGWKGARGSAIRSRPQTERFYRDVAAWAAANRWLVTSFLRLNGRPIAFELAIKAGGVCYALKSGFDPTFAACSPGKLLIHSSIRRAHELGLDRYEMAGVEPYKLAWTNRLRDLAAIRVFAPSPSGLVDWAACRYMEPRARKLVTAARRPRAHPAARG